MGGVIETYCLWAVQKWHKRALTHEEVFNKNLKRFMLQMSTISEKPFTYILYFPKYNLYYASVNLT